MCAPSQMLIGLMVTPHVQDLVTCAVVNTQMLDQCLVLPSLKFLIRFDPFFLK